MIRRLTGVQRFAWLVAGVGVLALLLIVGILVGGTRSVPAPTSESPAPQVGQVTR